MRCASLRMRSKDACELGGPSHEIDPVFHSSQITSIFDNDIPFREIPKRSSLNGEVDESVARGCSTSTSTTVGIAS
jgi:hypothetical protein